MLLTAHQPQLLSYPGYFDKIDQADVFVHVDSYGFSRDQFMNRNRLRTKDGWQWLTVPTQHCGLNPAINDVLLGPKPWARKKAATLQQLYGRAGDWVDELCELMWRHEFGKLVDLDIEGDAVLMRQLGIETPALRESDVRLSRPADRDESLIELCRRMGCDGFLAGPNGQYLDAERFERAGLQLLLQDFELQPYAQAHPGWQTNLSMVDMLARQPNALATLRRDRKAPIPASKDVCHAIRSPA